MFCFNLRSGFSPLAIALKGLLDFLKAIGSYTGMLFWGSSRLQARFSLGVVLAACLLVGSSPAAKAFQMPMEDDPVEEEQADDDEKDLMRVEWFKFNPTGSRAQFEMPAKPRFVERTLPPVIKGSTPVKVRLHIATVSEGLVSFIVNYNDLTELPRRAKGVANTLEGVIRGSLANVSGQLLNKTEIVLNGNIKGRQFAYGFVDNKDNQYVVLSRAYVRGRRVYQLSALMDKRVFNETIAARFLNSFKIVRAKSDMPPIPKAPPKSESLPSR